MARVAEAVGVVGIRRAAGFQVVGAETPRSLRRFPEDAAVAGHASCVAATAQLVGIALRMLEFDDALCDPLDVGSARRSDG